MNGLHICTNWKKSLPRERILSPAEQKKLRCEQRQREEIIQQEKAEADYHRTTVTKVDRRSNEKNYLTSKTNTFHNEMTEHSQHYINAKDIEHQCQIQIKKKCISLSKVLISLEDPNKLADLSLFAKVLHKIHPMIPKR